MLVFASSWACRTDDRSPLPAGCASKTGAEMTPPPGVTTCQVEADVSVSVSGAHTFSHKGLTKVVGVELFGGKIPSIASLVTWQIPEPVTVDEAVSYRAGFQVDAGKYRGAGGYELVKAEPRRDDAYLEVVEVTDKPNFKRFDVFLEPCQVRVARHVLSGSMTCPKLGSNDRASVAVEMSWKAKAS